MHLRQRDAYEGDRSGQSGLSRYVACQVYGTWFHRCMVSCSTKLGWVWQGYAGAWSLSQGACRWSWHWTYSEHTVNATLNTHWTQSKKLQIAANLCSWWWFSEKTHKSWISFDFHPFALSFSFLSVLCLVHCMFNVRSVSVHSERMVPVVKKYAVCEGRRGKRNRFYFGFHLCSFVFATFAERALCSGYCWWTKSCTTLFAP